jgi:hypothetical protein
VFTVNVEVPEFSTAGTKPAVAPAGNPLMLSETEPMKLPFGVTETVKVVFDPCTTVLEAGDADTVKLGANKPYTAIWFEKVAR